MTGGFCIRSANEGDAKRLLEIYSPYVLETAVSFECQAPSLEEFTARMQRTQKKFPYLCLEENGTIAGYAYASPFHEREAYRHCAELTIYLAREFRGRGYGRALYEALESRLKEIGILNAYACIAHAKIEDEYLCNDSERFHSRLGFKKCGEFSMCGKKFGRWYDMIWMEKFIGNHGAQKL